MSRSLVSRSVLLFSIHGAFAFVIVLVRCAACCSPPCFYAHSDELSYCKLGAFWGSRGESMLPFLGRSLRPKPTRSHRNTVSSQRVNIVTSMQLFRRRAYRAPESSRCDAGAPPAYVLRQQQPCSSLAYLRGRQDVCPTVGGPSLVRAVGGCGWHTRSAGFVDKRCRPS